MRNQDATDTLPVRLTAARSHLLDCSSCRQEVGLRYGSAMNDSSAANANTDLKLGYSIGYWSAGPPEGILETISEAERLGFNSIWTAEAYGSDVLTPLAWWGAKTTRLQLGTAIMQMSARTPAAAAMAAITMDHLSNGRFKLGARCFWPTGG
jgi:hypothetical protein